MLIIPGSSPLITARLKPCPVTSCFTSTPVA
ncbi:hypothetical protein MTATph1_CDS0219 [Moorella phage MTATph1]